jgi:pimeloyl-ACP methyl ester carboxylesterase
VTVASEQDGQTPRRYVDAGGVHTYYEVVGDGDPLVLLHGGFATIDTWGAQTPALAERYRVYLPERRGHGRTPDVPGPTGYDVMAQDTIAFMDALGISAAHLVGWSDGGNVGLEVALTRPDLVRKLVLIGAAANFEGYTPALQAMASKMTPDIIPSSMRQAYDALSPDGPAHFPVVFEKLTAVWKTEPHHPLGDLERLAAPTLVMLGDDDDVTIEHAAAMQRAIPDAQLAVVPGTDHALMFEKPEVVNRLILDFLAAEQVRKLFSQGEDETPD